MAIYRELFFNNIDGFMSGSFPVLKKIIAPARWKELVRGFMVDYRASTPLFPELSREILQYLQGMAPNNNDPDFLLELAHYEWVEAALGFSDHDIEPLFKKRCKDVSGSVFLLSPVAWLLQYRHQVHRISPKFQPDRPAEQATLLLVHRNLKDRVRFSELNPVTARLLELVRDNEHRSGLELISQLSTEYQRDENDIFIEQGLGMLHRFHQLDAIYCR